MNLRAMRRNVDIAPQMINHIDFMTFFLGCFDNPFVRIQIWITAHKGKFHSILQKLTAKQIRRARIDNASTANRSTSDKQAKPHLVSIGQRKLDGPNIPAETHRRLNNVTYLTFSVRTFYDPFVDKTGDAAKFQTALMLDRVEIKFDLMIGGFAKFSDAKRMDSRSSRARVDFRLNPVNP
jgi:hypothetical protein